MSGYYERKGSALGAGVGAGLGAFVHTYVIANILSVFKTEKDAGHVHMPTAEEKMHVTNEQFIYGLEVTGYLAWMLVGSVIAVGLAGYFAGKKIGEKIDNVYPV